MTICWYDDDSTDSIHQPPSFTHLSPPLPTIIVLVRGTWRNRYERREGGNPEVVQWGAEEGGYMTDRLERPD